MKVSYKVALCGLMSAMSIAIMFLSGVIPGATYAAPALAGILFIVLVIETGVKWSFMAFVATGIVSMLIVADKEASALFVMFLGYYPILKSVVERLKPRALQWVIKYAVFNAGVVTAFFISINLLSVPKESFEIGGVYVPGALLLAGNAIFLLYDLTLSRIVSQYINYWRKKLKFLLIK